MEPEPTIKKDSQRKTATAILAVIAVCILAFIILDRTEIADALNQLKLIPTPEPFTELYFDNAISLPTTTVADKPMSFSFTIHNEEGTSTAYPYEVYFISDANTARKLLLAGDTVTLANDASTTINVIRRFPLSNAQGKVVVDLIGLNQQIDFLLPNANL